MSTQISKYEQIWIENKQPQDNYQNDLVKIILDNINGRYDVSEVSIYIADSKIDSVYKLPRLKRLYQILHEAKIALEQYGIKLEE